MPFTPEFMQSTSRFRRYYENELVNLLCSSFAEKAQQHGIRLTADALKSGKIVICTPCADAIREFGAYCWDLRSGERDKVKKVCDHAMDEIRYFVATIVAGEESGAQFFVGAVERRGW